MSETNVDGYIAKLRFEFFQSLIQLALRFAKTDQVIVQANVRLATSTHDCFTVTNLAQKRSCPEIAAWAKDVNALSVEIDRHAIKMAPARFEQGP
jgi:hypothetical protein